PRGPKRRGGQWGARPALVPGKEDGLVCRTGRPPDASNVHLVILHAALDETFFCACLRCGNERICVCCCFSPVEEPTVASSPSTGISVKVWNFSVNKRSNSAKWSLRACAMHCWIAA